MNRHDRQTKLQSLVCALTNCDRRRSYRLSLATCYFTPQALHDLIEAIPAEVKLVEICLYLDRRTAISIGHTELSRLEREYPDLISIHVVRSERLFHTKGYCLAAYAASGELVHGRLAIGSANLTMAGLTGEHGNVESLAVHSDLATIGEFLEFFECKDNLITLDELTEFSPDDETDFRYALLTYGQFSHKWSANLSNYLSARFRLNEKGRQRAREGIDMPEFSMEAATIGRTYFDFDLDRWQPGDENLVRDFGIECFLGRWIPKSVIDDDEATNEDFEKFEAALFEQLASKMDSICREISYDCDSLVQEGIIDRPELDPAQSFRDRIVALEEDSDQLYRIWTGRKFFEFPYDHADADAIHDTFEDLMRTVRRSRRRNRSMRAVLDAEANVTIEPLKNLSVADR